MFEPTKYVRVECRPVRPIVSTLVVGFHQEIADRSQHQSDRRNAGPFGVALALCRRAFPLAVPRWGIRAGGRLYPIRTGSPCSSSRASRVRTYPGLIRLSN